MLRQGQCLILSGASRGIGRALALGLAQRGLNLVLNAREVGPLGETAQECRRQGVQAQHLAGSVAAPAVCSALVDLAQELGELAGFIHAAGVLHPGPYLWELSPGQAAEVLEASLGGALALLRATAPALQAAGHGLAVFFGSGAAQRHQPGIGLYSAAKAAEEFIAGQAAAEAPWLSAFVFRPGVVDTRMQAQARGARGGAAEQLRPVFLGYRAQGMLYTPERAAGALLQALEGDWQQLRGRVIDARQVLGDE